MWHCHQRATRLGILFTLFRQLSQLCPCMRQSSVRSQQNQMMFFMPSSCSLSFRLPEQPGISQGSLPVQRPRHTSRVQWCQAPILCSLPLQCRQAGPHARAVAILSRNLGPAALVARLQWHPGSSLRQSRSSRRRSPRQNLRSAVAAKTLSRPPGAGAQAVIRPSAALKRLQRLLLGPQVPHQAGVCVKAAANPSRAPGNDAQAASSPS